MSLQSDKKRVFGILEEAGIYVTGGIGISSSRKAITIRVTPGDEQKAEEELRHRGIKSPLEIKGVKLPRKLIRPITGDPVKKWNK